MLQDTSEKENQYFHIPMRKESTNTTNVVYLTVNDLAD